VLAGGALMTPRLLLLSGVGPFARHDEIFADGFSVPFHIDNPGIGMSLFDHVATGLVYEYTGSVPPYRAYHYDDYAANGADLTRYVGSRSGSYAQYGPVSVMHARLLAPRQANVEVFVNPFGAGASSGRYNGPHSFSAYTMLLRPRARRDEDQPRHLRRVSADLSDERGRRGADVGRRAAADLPVSHESQPDLGVWPGRALTSRLESGQAGRRQQARPGLRSRGRRLLRPPDHQPLGGTCPLGGGIDPATLRVEGTQNVHVVDASLHPAPLFAHPVATIMAVAEKASDLLTGELEQGRRHAS